MIKAELYDSNNTYITPSSNVLTPEEFAEKFPASKTLPFVCIMQGNTRVVSEIRALSVLCGQYGIDESLPVEAKLKAIEDIKNAPPVAAEPNEWERLAWALEALCIIQDEETNLERKLTGSKRASVGLSENELNKLKRAYKYSVAYSEAVLDRLIERSSITYADKDLIIGG